MKQSHYKYFSLYLLVVAITYLFLSFNTYLNYSYIKNSSLMIGWVIILCSYAWLVVGKLTFSIELEEVNAKIMVVNYLNKEKVFETISNAKNIYFNHLNKIVDITLNDDTIIQIPFERLVSIKYFY